MTRTVLGGFAAVLLFAGCHSNPYSGLTGRISSDPVQHKPGDGAVGFDITYTSTVRMTEGTSITISIVPKVPDPGKPVLILNGVPSWCSAYNPAKATMTCVPPQGAASDPNFPGDSFASYPINLKLTSTQDPVTEVTRTMTLLVTHPAANLTVNGFDQDTQVEEGKTYTGQIQIQDADTKAGPFYPSLINAPVGLTITPTSDPTVFNLSYTPGFNTVTLTNHTGTCDDESDWSTHLCNTLTWSMTVLDKYGSSVTMNATWQILDMRQDPVVVLPDNVTGTASKTGTVDFYINVEDPNGEATPQVTAESPDTGTLTPTVASSGINKGIDPYTLVHVVWSGDFSSYKNSVQTINLQACSEDMNGAFNQCVTQPVNVKF